MIVKNYASMGYMWPTKTNQIVAGSGYAASRRRSKRMGDFITDGLKIIGGVINGITGQTSTQPVYVPPPPPPPPDYTTPALIVGGTVLGGIVLYSVLK